MTDTPRYVLRLTDAAAVPLSATGVKAGTLARLAADGFPVPSGFVVTSAARSHEDAVVG